MVILALETHSKFSMDRKWSRQHAWCRDELWTMIDCAVVQESQDCMAKKSQLTSIRRRCDISFFCYILYPLKCSDLRHLILLTYCCRRRR